LGKKRAGKAGRKEAAVTFSGPSSCFSGKMWQLRTLSVWKNDGSVDGLCCDYLEQVNSDERPLEQPGLCHGGGFGLPLLL